MSDPRQPVIVGVHTTKQTRDSKGRTGLSYGLEALKGALDDAGMERQEVEGLYPMVSQWPPGLMLS